MSHSTACQPSLPEPFRRPVLSARYSRIAPDSISETPVSWSTIAGILLFGLIARNSGLNCSFALMSTAIARYGSPTSSSMIDTLRPFGVVHVYKSIMNCALAHKEAAILPPMLAMHARLANHGRRRNRDGRAMPLGLLSLAIQVIAA